MEDLKQGGAVVGWHPWRRFVVVLTLGTLYVTTFWGGFGHAWPRWVRWYTGCVLEQAWRWYHRGAAQVGWLDGPVSGMMQYRLVWLAVSVVMGAVVPLALAWGLGRRGAELGLRRSNRWGWRVVAVCAVVVVPFALLLALERLGPGRVPWAGMPMWGWAGVMLGVSFPEHFLLTGVGVAVFLRDWRLPTPAPLAPVEGAALRRALRWLGLGQPGRPNARWGSRALAWWGLDADGLRAIVGGGLLFGVVHVGAGPLELVTSFPGGMAVCYVSYRSGSIWPGWLVHIIQMALAMVVMMVRVGHGG